MPNLASAARRVILAMLALCAAGPVAAAQRLPSVTRLAAVGCAECDGPAAFTEIVDVAVTAEGMLWVADSDAPKVRGFDRAGRHVRSFGRGGQGPGEYGGISRVLMLRDGSLAVVDHRAQRVTRLDSTGRNRSAVAIGGFPFDAAAGPHGELYVLSSRFAPGTTVVLRFDAEADSAHRVSGGFDRFPWRNALGGPQSLAIAPNADIALAEGTTDYLVRIYGPAGTERDIRRAIPLAEYSPEEIAAMRRGATARSRRNQREAQASGAAVSIIPREVSGPRVKPHFALSGLRYDGRGRLWVKTMRGGAGTTIFDVFAPDDVYLGEIVVPERVTRFDLAGPYLATSGFDDEEIPRVTLWRVEG